MPLMVRKAGAANPVAQLVTSGLLPSHEVRSASVAREYRVGSMLSGLYSLCMHLPYVAALVCEMLSDRGLSPHQGHPRWAAQLSACHPPLLALLLLPAAALPPAAAAAACLLGCASACGCIWLAAMLTGPRRSRNA